jgi:putative acetyltransferase
MSQVIRSITAADNAAVPPSSARHAGAPGFAIHDAEVVIWLGLFDSTAAYSSSKRGRRHGGGIAPLIGGDADTCELRKMYFLPSLRGLGAGNALMQTCIAKAREFDFDRIYLETLTGMDAAKKLYRMSGFEPVKNPLGRTGHFSCDSFFVRKL